MFTALVKCSVKWLVAMHFDDASDEIKGKVAELYGLNVTVFPGDSPKSFRLQLSASIPLEFKGVVESPESLQMVLASSRGGRG